MKVGIGHRNESDAFASGKKATEDALEKGGISRPDLVFAFCQGDLDHDLFFEGIRSAVGNEAPIIGGSAIGVITNDYLSYEGCPSGIAALQSDALKPRIAAANDLDRDERLAGKKLAEKLSGRKGDKLLFILYDSIKTPGTEYGPPAMNASSPLIEGIEEGLPTRVPIIGAGLIGDYEFGPTRQFCGSHVGGKSVTGLMLGGDFEPYFRIMHGCTPLDGIYHRITRMDGAVIYELDGEPVVKMIDDAYGNQDWRLQRPVQLLTLGRNHGGRFDEPDETHYVNRLITGIMPDGEGIGIFEPDFESGTEIQFMIRDTVKMIESARKNAAGLMEQIGREGRRAFFGLYIDCAGRAANHSNTPTEEAREVQKVLNRYDTPLLGFYSGVEVAPLLERSRGLDWTGVLLIFAGGREHGRRKRNPC